MPSSPDEFIRAVRQYLNEGYEVQITELDLSIKNAVYNGEKAQADYYSSLFKQLLEIKSSGGNLTGITFWGMADNVSWLKEYSPLLFTKIREPKKGYYQVLQTYLDEGYTVNN